MFIDTVETRETQRETDRWTDGRTDGCAAAYAQCRQQHTAPYDVSRRWIAACARSSVRGCRLRAGSQCRRGSPCIYHAEARAWSRRASGADERGADARGADERGADERGDDARGAGERDADERGDDERGAGERGADERGADERGADERGADERGADARGADARGADERGADARGAGELDNDERGADARGAGERAMPKSAMAYGVAALPHQHGNVSQAMRGWEARLTAGIRARCTQWVSARQSYLTTSTCLLGLAGGQVRLAVPSCAQGRRWLGAATAGDTRDAAGLCAQRQRVRLTARTPIVVGKLPRSRSGW